MVSTILNEDLFKDKLNIEATNNINLIFDDIKKNSKYSKVDDLTIILAIFKQLKEESYLQSLVKLNFTELNNNLITLNKKKIELLKKKG